MVAKIRPAYSTTTGAVPATTNADEAGEIAVNLTDRKLFARSTAGVPVQITQWIGTYSAERQYAVGDLTLSGNNLYACTTAITTPEAFNAGKWQQLGSAGSPVGAVLLAPDSTDRNLITPGGNFPALKLAPGATQAVDLLEVGDWAKHDARGIPYGAYGELVRLIAQATHPFSAIGQPVGFDYTANTYGLPGGPGTNSYSLVGIVAGVIDANNFLVQTSGVVRDMAAGAFTGGSIVASAWYGLSRSEAGKLVRYVGDEGLERVLYVEADGTTGLVTACRGVAVGGFSVRSDGKVTVTNTNDVDPTGANTITMLTTGANALVTVNNAQGGSSVAGSGQHGLARLAGDGTVRSDAADLIASGWLNFRSGGNGAACQADMRNISNSSSVVAVQVNYDAGASNQGLAFQVTDKNISRNTFKITRSGKLTTLGDIITGAEYNEGADVEGVNLQRFGRLDVQRLSTNSGASSAAQIWWGTNRTFNIRADGDVANANNSYGALSDVVLKQDIVDASPKLDELLGVRVVNYALKTNPDTKLLGVIAQELELIWPGLVSEDEAGIKSVKYSVMVPILIKALQELTARVEALESNS